MADSSFSGPLVPEGVVSIPFQTFADWGDERLAGGATLATGSGAPSDPATDDFYIDLDTFAFYVDDGGSWVLTPYTFNLNTPTPTDVDFADYWWHVDAGNNLLGIYGPKVDVPSPADGDVPSWDAAGSTWVADGSIARTGESNTFTVSGQVIAGDDAAEVPLTVRGVSGQTANLVVVESHDGTDRFTISDAGYTTTANVQAAGGVRVGTAVSYTTNQKWLSIDNAASVPSAVTSGAIAYAENGELKARSALANVGLTAKRVAVKTGAHTFEGVDQGAIVVLNSSSNFNFTIPEDASVNFPVGTVILVAVQSTGHATVVGSGAATVTGATVLNTAGQIGTLIKVAANTWLCHH